MKNHKKIKVMVVDDSAIIRGMFATVLDSDPDIDVVTTAANGRVALDILKRNGGSNIDIITLDIEMPEMDGITALPQILKIAPNAKVIIVSSLSTQAASETLKALSMGATDYMAKPALSDERQIMHNFTRELVDKVKILGSTDSDYSAKKLDSIGIIAKGVSNDKDIIEEGSDHYVLRKKRSLLVPSAIAIGASTGGPQALSKFFADLKNHNVKVPIFITQHMPANFTTILAEQISNIGNLKCYEAEDGMEVESGKVYLAAGDYHMIIKKRDDNSKYLHLSQAAKENFCRPAVDPMLESLITAYNGNLLVIIMTGMGSDGLVGAKKVADCGGSIIAQDKDSSVVWGMPKAVADAGICSSIVPINQMASETINLSKGCII